MSPEQSDDQQPPDGGVLAALPRTRPQRASARRTAARARTQSETAARPAKAGTKTVAKTKPKPKPKAGSKTKPATKPARQKPAGATRRSSVKRHAPREERVPKQGYEPEEEVELGRTVHPPGGAELIESLADIVGELAGAGASAGGRLLKDALSIFRRS